MASRENYQRNGIAKGLKEASPEDLILISDVDEIPNLSKLKLENINNEIILFDKLLGSYEVLFVICAFIIAISMNAFILIREEGAMGVRTFLRQLIFYRKQLP